MEQAKTSLQLALLQLNNKDSFNIIAFDDDTELLFSITQMTSAQNISTALQFIDDLKADGGTEMYRPLSNALMMKKNEVQSVKAIRQIVFIYRRDRRSTQWLLYEKSGSIWARKLCVYSK